MGRRRGEKGETGNVASGPAQRGWFVVPKQVRSWEQAETFDLKWTHEIRFALKRNSDFVENVFGKKVREDRETRLGN